MRDPRYDQFTGGQVHTDTLESKILAALNALGPTEEDVVNTLRARGVRASHRSEIGMVCETCPIAVYLKRVTGDLSVWVATEHTHAGAERPVYIDNPQPVANFIRHYDNHQYPEFEYAAE